MADKTAIKWLYPPNFLGTYEDLGPNAPGKRKYVVKCTNYSDGTGESDAVKVKRTDLRTPDGKIPGRLVIEKIVYQIAGMTVYVSYNNMNDELVANLYSGEGERDFSAFGGFVPQDDDTGDAYAGDIVFSTDNETSGDSYDITLHIRTKQ